MKTINTVAQELDTKLQAFVTEEAMTRIRVAAAVENRTQGQVLTDLVIRYLPPAPGKPFERTKSCTD